MQPSRCRSRPRTNPRRSARAARDLAGAPCALPVAGSQAALDSKWVAWEITKHNELNPEGDRLLPIKLEPLKLPKGTQLSLTAHYDNSPQNPKNPNKPPKPVKWGEQTTDEMCIAFVAYTNDEEHLTKGINVKDPFDFTGGGRRSRRGR